MKFIAVCSFGVGSSMILRMSIEKAVRRLGIEAEAENIDISSAKGLPCDAVFTSIQIAEEIGVSQAQVSRIEKKVIKRKRESSKLSLFNIVSAKIKI